MQVGYLFFDLTIALLELRRTRRRRRRTIYFGIILASRVRVLIEIFLDGYPSVGIE